MSPLAALRARRVRRVTDRAAARPCCFGRCTTADQRAAQARAAATCPCGCGRPAGQHWPPVRLTAFPAQRTTEES